MKLIIANWKMNPTSVAEAVELAKATDYDNIILCPPFPFIGAVKSMVKKARVGAQNLFWKNPSGPFTGEVSAAELKSLGVEYVIIGHSERRRLGETNEIISQKLVAAIEIGLIPILCVGETLEEKNSGQKEKVISEQIKTPFGQLSNVNSQMSSDIYVAVEPVWAISTNVGAEVDNPDNTLSTIDLIKKELFLNESGVKCLPTEARRAQAGQMPAHRSSASAGGLNVHFLYGGSISSGNVVSFLEHPEIEGALVGGASLKSEEIAKIMRVAQSF